MSFHPACTMAAIVAVSVAGIELARHLSQPLAALPQGHSGGRDADVSESLV